MRVEKVLIRREQIARRIAELGAQIAAELEAERTTIEQTGANAGPLVLVPVLTGALVFAADLVRNMPVSMSIRPVTLSSYPGKATASQGVTVQSGIPTDLKGARVLVVDDILDSGRTLGLLRRVIQAQQPQSLRLAVLLNKTKQAGREEEVAVEYFGFRIDDEFVVGYGLDYDGYYRNLPDIVTLASVEQKA